LTCLLKTPQPWQIQVFRYSKSTCTTLGIHSKPEYYEIKYNKEGMDSEDEAAQMLYMGAPVTEAAPFCSDLT